MRAHNLFGDSIVELSGHGQSKQFDILLRVFSSLWPKIKWFVETRATAQGEVFKIND
jgi:hypothetical protein